MIRQLKRGGQGFTLIELVVVIAILGILAGIITPVVTGYLTSGKEEAYRTDRKLIQRLVDLYMVNKTNPKYKGDPQFPIKGAAKGGGTFYTGDADATPELVAGGISGNPQAGTAGGDPVWADDGDGIREAGEETLNDEDTTPPSTGTAPPPAVPGWYVTTRVVKGTTYYVDTRDYFIDFDLFITLGMLREPPGSAAADSCSTSTCTGSYIYYVKANGAVETLLASFPASGKTGFQSVYP